MAEVPPETASVFSTSTTLSLLSKSAATAFLERIQLPSSLLSAPPSLELLAQLQLASLLSVPFDTSVLHVPAAAWNGDSAAPIVLGGGDAMPLGQGAFDRIVRDRRGGYCFSLNSTFAAFLRSFGFRVSEMAARVYAALGKDPEEAGLMWGPTSHECLVVDWETDGVRSERYFVDVGFGSGQSNIPLLLDDPNQTSSQTHRILCSPGLPLPPASVPFFPDTLPHYILSRLASLTPSPPYWTPLYTFALLNTAAPDFVVYNHYNSTHPSAAFTRFFVCSKVLEGGRRRSIYYREGMGKEGEEGEWAKLVTVGSGVAKEEESVEWVRMRVGDVKQVLEREFGMVF